MTQPISVQQRESERERAALSHLQSGLHCKDKHDLLLAAVPIPSVRQPWFTWTTALSVMTKFKPQAYCSPCKIQMSFSATAYTLQSILNCMRLQPQMCFALKQSNVQYLENVTADMQNNLGLYQQLTNDFFLKIVWVDFPFNPTFETKKNGSVSHLKNIRIN